MKNIEILRKNLSKNIRYLRGRMTQLEIADRAGMSLATYHRIEKNQDNPCLWNIVKICCFHGISIEDILFFDLEENEKQK